MPVEKIISSIGSSLVIEYHLPELPVWTANFGLDDHEPVGFLLVYVAAPFAACDQALLAFPHFSYQSLYREIKIEWRI